jgi:hypothetical protein
LQEFKVPDKEWAGIEELFLKCDENHDGVISQEELVSAIVEITKAAAGNDGADAGLVVVGTAARSQHLGVIVNLPAPFAEMQTRVARS